MSSIHLQIGLLIPLLLWASICDLRTRQIPNAVPITIFLLGLIHFFPFFSFAGLLCTGLPYWIGAICSGGKIGGGDIKLMAPCGFVFGPLYGTLQSLFGLGLVLLFATGMALRHGFQAAKYTALPLAPFLSAGGGVVILLAYLAR